MGQADRMGTGQIYRKIFPGANICISTNVLRRSNNDIVDVGSSKVLKSANHQVKTQVLQGISAKYRRFTICFLGDCQWAGRYVKQSELHIGYVLKPLDVILYDRRNNIDANVLELGPLPQP